jgi:hypothetical protein
MGRGRHFTARGFALLGLALASLAASVAAAAPADEACRTAAANINTLVPAMPTDCIGSGAQETDLIFVTTANVFGDEKRKKAYLLVAVAAAGEALTRTKANSVKRISIMDLSLGKAGQAFQISAKDARKLQRQVAEAEISVEKMYAGILTAGTIRTVKK